ncbi:MAG: helix-turn-helix domain-containing protein, partial [Pyrinomonadaceae bacterium]
VPGIAKDALLALINYDWPGNIRELENAVERGVIIASGRQIELEDLPEAISRATLEERATASAATTTPRRERVRLAAASGPLKLEIEVPSTLDDIERRAIETTLAYTGGDKTHAARALGIGRKTLYRKLQEYGGDA